MKRCQPRRFLTRLTLVALLLSTVRATKADLFDFVKIIINPGGSLIEKAVEEGGKVIGVDPKPIQTLVNPTPVIIEQAPKAIVAEVKVHIDFLKAQADLVNAVVTGNAEKAAEAIVAATSAEVKRAINPGVVPVLQPFISPLVPSGLREATMQPPDVHGFLTDPGQFGGEPVYYVNGMDTPREKAEKEAIALATQISRPVRLIYNSTNGFAADLTEAAYDRSWPFLVPVVGQLVQANDTTRQAAHLIYHSKIRVSIVSHSQGCLIIRNALMMANAYTGGHAKNRVTWVATGLPLRDEEIYPKPDRFRTLANTDDTICQSIGLQLNPEKFTSQNAGIAHDFIDAYVGQIRSEDLR